MKKKSLFEIQFFYLFDDLNTFKCDKTTKTE